MNLHDTLHNFHVFSSGTRYTNSVVGINGWAFTEAGYINEKFYLVNNKLIR